MIRIIKQKLYISSILEKKIINNMESNNEMLNY